MFASILILMIFLFSFNNPDKGAVTHAIVHRALWEYLAAVDSIEDESERDKLRRDIFEKYATIFSFRLKAV